MPRMSTGNPGPSSMRGRWDLPKQRGLVVALGVVAAICVGVPLIVRRFSGAHQRVAEITEAREAMQVIRAAAYRWHVLHGESTCPSIRQLVEGKFLDPTARKQDPWEQPFVITCWESGAVVTSFGPDRKRATPDDIEVSTPNSELGNGK